jgi:isopentenyldiphosphate isomerase
MMLYLLFICYIHFDKCNLLVNQQTGKYLKMIFPKPWTKALWPEHPKPRPAIVTNVDPDDGPLVKPPTALTAAAS